MFKATEGRWGTREIEITGVTLLGGDGQPGHVFQYGEAVRVQMNVRAHQALKDFVFGFGIFNADGVCCYGTNTNLEELQPDEISGEGVGHASRSTASKLVEGTYRLDLAAHKLDGYPYDYHRLLYSFRVKSRDQGRRHLPSRSSLDVLARHPLQARTGPGEGLKPQRTPGVEPHPSP